MGIEVVLPEFYLESTPREVKNSSQYEVSGVYIFYDNYDIPLYVGKTVSFRRRFGKHSTNSEFYSLSTKVLLYTVKNEYEKDVYETYLINELKPQYNRAKSFYSRLEYEDMLHRVEEKIYDIKYEIDEANYLLTELHEEEIDISDGDYETFEESDFLGESALLYRQVSELEQQLKRLYLRKANLIARLSA